MLIGVIILGFFVIGISTAYSFLLLKYKNLKSQVNSIMSELKNPIKIGYYKTTLTLSQKDKPDVPFDVLIYVKELDHYTNGDSKIEIHKIEPSIDATLMSHDRIEKYVKDGFVSLIKSTKVEWLESEHDIKEVRKNKLEQLKKSLNETSK